MPTSFRTHRHSIQHAAIRGVCSPNTLAADYSHWCAGAVGAVSFLHFVSVEVSTD